MDTGGEQLDLGSGRLPEGIPSGKVKEAMTQETCESLDKSEGQALEDAIADRAGVIAGPFSHGGVSA
jgi:hypothetical protein